METLWTAVSESPKFRPFVFPVEIPGPPLYILVTRVTLPGVGPAPLAASKSWRRSSRSLTDVARVGPLRVACQLRESSGSVSVFRRLADLIQVSGFNDNVALHTACMRHVASVDVREQQ